MLIFTYITCFNKILTVPNYLFLDINITGDLGHWTLTPVTTKIEKLTEMTFLDSFSQNIPCFPILFIIFIKIPFINFTSCKNQNLKIRAWPLCPAPKMEEMRFLSIKKCQLWLFWPSDGNFDNLALIYEYFYGLNKILKKIKKWAWPNNCPLIMQFQENGPYLRADKTRLQYFYT